MDQTGKLPACSTEGSFRYQVRHGGFIVNQAVPGQVFLRVPLFLCQYDSTNAPYSFLSKCYPYQYDKGAKSENLPNSRAVSKKRGGRDQWIKLFSLLSLK